MSAEQDRGLVIELQGIDKRVLSAIWAKMRGGEPLNAEEHYIGRSMADHPDWFPVFETMDVLGGQDELPDGTNPFAHLTMHIIIGSQINHQNPPEAEVFYRIRQRKGDHPHDIVHMMMNVFQRHLYHAARTAGQDGKVSFDGAAYGATLKELWPLKTKKLWERLGFAEIPKRHAPTGL